MKKDRHTKIEVACEVCGTLFMARKERVDKGQGRFCGHGCFNEWQRSEKKNTIWGRKDLATIYKSGSRHIARWYDENGKSKSCTYPRWWWETNVGEIPSGMIVLYKDNDPQNNDPENFILGTKSDALRVGNQTRKSNPASWAEYQNSQSIRMVKKWESGDFDSLRGSGHYRWKGGTAKDIYPDSFYEIRDFIRNRDRNVCQICGKDVSKNSRSGHVHHIDGNKKNSDQDNLILLCRSCHSRVHTKSDTSPVIMAFRSKLLE